MAICVKANDEIRGVGDACELATAGAPVNWRVVDRALRGIALRRAALDAEEARWLREAEALQIWRPLGMVNALDYMERVLGYTPHAALERLRVARALAELPVLAGAFARGEVHYSGMRELTRVATPDTEGAWRDVALGKNVRQIEELVSGHQKGDHPDDPADPDLRRRTVRLDLSAEVFARLRQTQAALADEHGARLDDDQLITALCDAALDGRGDAAPTGRAKFQIGIVLCRRCGQGWQHGGGLRVAIDEPAVERARCDAQHVGDLDTDLPVQAAQDVPPRVVRQVWERDGGRCQTPGCRSARGLEIHHIVRRADGGTHEASNLRLQCSACHLAVHRGTLEITGSPEQLEVRRPKVSPSHGASHVGPTIVRTQARDALVNLGWKPAIARAAIDAACAELGAEATLDHLIREALRRCPKPMTG